VKGCVTNRNDWNKVIKNQDVIIHLAAETGTGQSMYEIERYTQVNIGGTSLMLDILANSEHTIKKVIVASSRSIYGEGKYWSEDLRKFVYPKHRLENDMSKGDFNVKYEGATNQLELVATDEDSKLHPSSVYGITKLNQEQLIMTVCPTIGINAVALRYQNVYGPGQSLSNPYTGILSIFSTLILNDKEINIFEDGLESRDFVFIDDVVNATILSVENDNANNEIFNVGSGIPVSVIDVANLLVGFFNSKENIRITGQFRLGDIRNNYADLTKINSLLGYTPKCTFNDGLKQFVDWVKTQSINESKYDQSIQELKEKGLLK
jgi:dTDP-L-rhamnose 4-epimerase